MANMKTTIAGILTIVLPLLGLLLKWINGEPITSTDIAMLSAAGTSGTGLWFARDASTKETVITQPLSGMGPSTMKTSV